MWVDGYWTGRLVDGYPETYFDNGRFEYPWEKNCEKVIDSVDTHDRLGEIKEEKDDRTERTES